MPMLPDILKQFSSSLAEVGTRIGYFLGIYSFMQFIAAPILGLLSDRYGRRPILLFTFFAALFNYILMATAGNFWILILGRALAGATTAIIPLVSSYIADISDDNNRTANFGWLGSAAAIGFSVGPFLGSWLGKWNVMAPFWAAAVFSLLAFLFVLLVMPESLLLKKQESFSCSKLYPLASIRKFFRPSALSAVVWVYALVFLSFQVIPSNWALYTQARIGWSAQEVGWSLSCLGILFAIGQGFLPKMVVPRLGQERALILGILLLGLSLVCFGLASKTWMIYAILILFTMSAHLIPTLQSVMAQLAPPDEQGELQGSLVALRGGITAMAPILYNKVLTWFTDGSRGFTYPGMAFFAAASLLLITLPLLQHTSRHQQNENVAR